jgi:O-antigen/teichoic acid export membrane protein
MLGPAAVAVYNLAMRLMAFIDLPLRSFVTTGMSEMAIQYNQKNIGHLTYIFKKYAGMLTIAFIPAALCAYLIADLITAFLGGHGYLDTQANELYQLFMFIAVLYPLDRFNGLALDILHHEKTNFMKVVVMLIAKVAFDFASIYLFERAFGAEYAIYGVAVSMLLSTIAGLLFGYYKLKKVIPHTLTGVIGMGFQELLMLVRSLGKRRQQV